jgi:pyruvyltransferase
MIKYYEHKPVEPNVGDTLSGLIIKHFLKEDLMDVGKGYTNKLVSCGSVMYAVCDNDTVWGTGIIKDYDKFPKDMSSVNFLAVRGKMTRDILLRSGAKYVPEVYGDPALLLPLIFPKRRLKKSFEIGYIPHYVDREYVSAGKNETIIDVALPIEEFIGQILRCKKIVSSSLHGIVIAEAYGIPAEWAVYSNKIVGGEFKFHDYLTGTGRQPQAPGELPAIPDLKSIQKGLIEALTKKRICVITRMHYPEDHPDFEWRFNYYKTKVLPTIKNQTFKNFDIAVWCEKHHEKLFKDLGVIPFQATHPEYNSKLFKDFTSWDNVSGLGEYEIQVALDSDDTIEPQFLSKINDICKGKESIHISFQPVKKGIKTGKIYEMLDNYEVNKTGSPCYALYQPDFKYFVHHDSHLRIGKLLDKTIYIPEGYVYMSIHDMNDSTGVKEKDIEIKRPKKMDVCYMLNTREEAKEILRYSIRSVEKNLNYRDIYIVGKKPSFLNQECREIRVNDRAVSNRFLNISEKLMAIINDPRVSENFIIMNDDFYILEKFKTIPYYYIGNISTYQKQLSEAFTGSHWKKILTQQLDMFPKGKMFTPHFPIVYNKKKLKELLKIEKMRESCMRSWYCNYYKVKGVKVIDKKIHKKDHLHLYNHSKFMSSSDWIEKNKDFLDFLREKFPNVSQYEYGQNTGLYFLNRAENIKEMLDDIRKSDYDLVMVGIREGLTGCDITLKNSCLIDGYFFTNIKDIEHAKKQIEEKFKTKVRGTKTY